MAIPMFNPATYLADKRNRRSFARALVIGADGKPASTIIPFNNPLNQSEPGWLAGAPPTVEWGNYKQADGTVLSQAVRFCWLPFHPLELQYLVGDGDKTTGDMIVHTFNGETQSGPYGPYAHIESYSVDLDKMTQSSAGFGWDRERNPKYQGPYNVDWYMQYWWIRDFAFGQLQLFWEETKHGDHHDDSDNVLAFYFPTR